NSRRVDAAGTGRAVGVIDGAGGARGADFPLLMLGNASSSHLQPLREEFVSTRLSRGSWSRAVRISKGRKSDADGSIALLNGPPPRVELGRACAVAHGAVDRDIAQLAALVGAAEHQPAAAHVPAADELRGKQHARAENSCEKLDVFSGGDAAQQHHVTLVATTLVQRLEAAQERRAIAAIVGVDRATAHLAQLLERHERVGAEQAAGSGDDESPV